MTDLSQYRIGPTETKDGYDAVIYAIYPEQIRPIHVAWRHPNGEWLPFSTAPEEGFLLPNATNTTVARWLPPDGSLTVSDTEREGWTRVEVPVKPVRGEAVTSGFYRSAMDRWVFGTRPIPNDTHRITLPTVGGDLVCGDYHDGAGNVIKVERING